jgi:hypothetical protein
MGVVYYMGLSVELVGQQEGILPWEGVPKVNYVV